MMSGAAGRSDDAAVRRRPEAAPGPAAARRASCTRSPSPATARRARRARWSSIARRARSRAKTCARPRCASRASSIRPRWRSPRSTPRARCCAPTPPSRGSRRPALRSDAPAGRPSIFDLVAERDHARAERGDRGGGAGQGRDRAARRVARGRGAARSARLFVSAADPRGDEGASATIFALDTTEQRTLQENLAQSQKMQAIGQLAGGVAHDFNNVLTAIIGYSDLLLANHRPTDPSFQDIMQIKQNANRAAGLVRQLLAFSRRQTLRPQTLQLNDVLSELQMLLRRLVGETIQLDVVLRARPVAGEGRPQPVRAGDRQSRRQCARRHAATAARSRCARATFRRPNAPSSRRWTLAPADYVLVEVAGHRPRHPARGPRQDLRAVLHHQGSRQGHRPRPVDGLWHRQADRRLCVLRQRAGRRRDVPHPAAAPHRR